MWIRSQNKKVLKPLGGLTIVNREFNEDCMIVLDDNTILGIYSSEEKAIKILDRIDEFKNEPSMIEEMTYEYAYYTEKTFQMPKDEEVE